MFEPMHGSAPHIAGQASTVEVGEAVARAIDAR
jgi:isocitrate/isopropylmalate dehydrogenase